jgi:uncharacterized protein
MMTIEHAWMWRRLDRAGHEGAYVVVTPAGRRVCGTALFVDAGRPCQLGYALNSDADWRLHRAHVFGTLGRELIDLTIEAGADRAWRVNGVPQAGTAGCIDLDLDFTPVPTCMLLQRLALAAGAAAACSVACLDVAAGRLTPASRHLRRLSSTEYRLGAEAEADDDSAVLRVDAHLAVVHHPGRWLQETETQPGRALLPVAQHHAANRRRDRDETSHAAREAA